MNRGYMFPHTVTVWRKSGEADVYGKYSYNVFTLKCRFEQSERLYINEYGQHQRANGYVFTKNDDILRGDIVIMGKYNNSDEPVDGAFEIKMERHISNIRGTKTEHRYTF